MRSKFIFGIITILAFATVAFASGNEYTTMSQIKAQYYSQNADKSGQYELIVEDGIDQKLAESVAELLPEATLSNAEYICVFRSPSGPEDEFLVYSIWAIDEILYSEVWYLTQELDSPILSPLLTIYTEDEYNSEIYYGYDDLYIQQIDNELNILEVLAAPSLEVVCEVITFLVDVIIPVLSYIWPGAEIVGIGLSLIATILGC